MNRQKDNAYGTEQYKVTNIILQWGDGRISFTNSFFRSCTSLYRENMIPQLAQVSEVGCSNLYLGHCII